MQLSDIQSPDPTSEPSASAGRRRGSLVGEQLDKYEVLQQVGEGGMATVYRGRHTTLGREVAIKVLHPHLSQSERNRTRFAREARAIENLDHDNILRIYDYSGTDTRDCYIVTEFVDGVTLQQLISEHGRLPSEVVALAALELTSALGYAHGEGIIHRDLKPENVMVRRDGAVKLMDFGIARFLDEVNLTVTGALVGSPAYMSPEQAMEQVLDSRSDLFSLGTLLFHAVTGQLPFSGSNPSIVLRNIIEGNRPEVLELVPEASSGLAHLIERLLERNVDARPADCAAVEAELRKVLADVGIVAEAPEWSVRTWVIDPEGYTERLGAHLSAVLLERGRQRIDAGDHLGAISLLNRLLALDEDNDEVLALVQGMHAAAPVPQNRWWGAAAVGGAVLAALLTWVLWPDPPVEVPPSPLPSPVDVEPPDGATTVETPPPGVEAPVAQPQGVEGPSEAGSSQPPRSKSTKKASSRPIPPPPKPPPPKPISRQDPGTISVFVDGSWGRIVVDGEARGRTGQVGRIALEPGKHTLRVENDFSLPWERSFEVSPGEHRPFEVTLTPRPSVLRFTDDADDGCLVTLDGEQRGTLASLGRTLTVADPRAVHTVSLDCGELGSGSKSYDPGELTPGTETQVRLP